jgi:hypothetical protein
MAVKRMNRYERMLARILFRGAGVWLLVFLGWVVWRCLLAIRDIL